MVLQLMLKQSTATKWTTSTGRQITGWSGAKRFYTRQGRMFRRSDLRTRRLGGKDLSIFTWLFYAAA